MAPSAGLNFAISRTERTRAAYSTWLTPSSRAISWFS